MNYRIVPMGEGDGRAVIDIFNHYVTHTLAAFPDAPFGYEMFDLFLQMGMGYPAAVAKEGEETVAFAMFQPHNPVPPFAHTAEFTCFVRPDRTGRGIGKTLLAYLENEGKARGITNILACIAAPNEASVAFHEKNGFTECGRFKNVGRKFGHSFDTIWMQKEL